MAKVLIIGASDSPDRYSFKALKMLEDRGHEVLLFSPKYDEILGHKVYKDFEEIPTPIDVITMYVNPKISETMEGKIVALNPRLIIFNPGTENSGLGAKVERAGGKSIDACTLVLLTTDQFVKVLEE